MKNIIVTFIIFTNFCSVFGQITKKDYFPSGQVRHEGKFIGEIPVGIHKYFFESGQLNKESYYDNTGLWTGEKEWDVFGNLLLIDNFQTKYKEYPNKDFSTIKWTKLSDGVFIHKYNIIDSITTTFTDTSFFKAHYICYFSNGKMLDNSYVRNNPLFGRIDYMFAGFQTGLKQMKQGERALIKIEPQMAFGDKIAGNVPAKSTLIYYIELISIE